MLKNKIYCGDCLPIMAQIADDSIDCIITDPPYGINYAKWDIMFEVEAVSSEWLRILKPSGSLFVFAGWSMEPELRQRMNPHLKLKDAIIYDRIKGRGGKKSLTSTREDILWYVKGDAWTFNKELAYSTIEKKKWGRGLKNGRTTRSLSNVWTDIHQILPWSKERVKHPTQKPVKLMERIITVFTQEGDLILDSFAGSGTVGVACKNLGRDFILIEKEPEYVAIIETRLETGR